MTFRWIERYQALRAKDENAPKFAHTGIQRVNIKVTRPRPSKLKKDWVHIEHLTYSVFVPCPQGSDGIVSVYEGDKAIIEEGIIKCVQSFGEDHRKGIVRIIPPGSLPFAKYFERTVGPGEGRFLASSLRDSAFVVKDNLVNSIAEGYPWERQRTKYGNDCEYYVSHRDSRDTLAAAIIDYETPVFILEEGFENILDVGEGMAQLVDKEFQNERFIGSKRRELGRQFGNVLTIGLVSYNRKVDDRVREAGRYAHIGSGFDTESNIKFGWNRSHAYDGPFPEARDKLDGKFHVGEPHEAVDFACAIPTSRRKRAGSFLSAIIAEYKESGRYGSVRCNPFSKDRTAHVGKEKGSERTIDGEITFCEACRGDDQDQTINIYKRIKMIMNLFLYCRRTADDSFCTHLINVKSFTCGCDICVFFLPLDCAYNVLRNLDFADMKIIESFSFADMSVLETLENHKFEDGRRSLLYGLFECKGHKENTSINAERVLKYSHENNSLMRHKAAQFFLEELEMAKYTNE